MFPYDSNPNCNYDYYNRRSWCPQQNPYVGNANLYPQQPQSYWDFDYPRSSLNNYYNHNNFNRRRNNYRSYSNRQTIRSSNRIIDNLTISPSINKEVDKNFTASNNIENDTKAAENIIDKNTTSSRASNQDVNNDEVDMEIDSDTDTVVLESNTSPDKSNYQSDLKKPKSDSTKEVIIEKVIKIKNKENKRRKSITDKEFRRPVKHKGRSSSIPSNNLPLLNPSGPSSMVTRLKSRENSILEREMPSSTKRSVTNEKNFEMSAKQPKLIADKPAQNPIKQGSILPTKTNAIIKPQLLNRDPRLQNRNDLKYKTSLSNSSQASMPTIGSNSSSIKTSTPQKDADDVHRKKMLMQHIFGEEDSPPKQSQTETVKPTPKEKEKKKKDDYKRKYGSLHKTKSFTKDKLDSTAKRRKNAEHNRKHERSLGEKKLSKILNMSTSVEVELIQEEVQLNMPELEEVPKTAQPIVHGELIPPCRITETSLQLCDDQVNVIDIEALPDISENSVGEDLLLKTEMILEEFGFDTLPSSDNGYAPSPVTEDSDIFEYLKESASKDNEIIVGDQNFRNEDTSDIPQIQSVTTDETSVYSPSPLHTSMDFQEMKFIPPETEDVKPILFKDAIILIEDDADQVKELVKIDDSDFAAKFACDFHCYHLVENTVYELSVNTATTMESKNNYLELFDSRKQIFDRISKTMHIYFQKHEILNFDCNRLIEEINKTYTQKCNSTITNLKILRFLHNVVLTWRKPENAFMKRFCDDIGHYMLLSNMEMDHEKNQPSKSIISSTSEAIVTKDPTSSPTVAVAAQTTVEQTQQVESTLSAKQTITISPRPIEQLLAKPHLPEHSPPVQQPIFNQTQPSVNNLSSPTIQSQTPVFSSSSTQNQGASYQITSPHSTSRTTESLPPTYQSIYEDQLNITQTRNSVQSPLNRPLPVVPTSSQIPPLIAKPKSRSAKKVVNKSQNQFIQPPQILSQPPPPYSTNLNTIENVYRNMIPGQNKYISSPTHHSQFQSNQNLPDTHNLGMAEVPTSQPSLWTLQRMVNAAPTRLPQCKQLQNNSFSNKSHPRFSQPTRLSAHLMQSRTHPITKNSTPGFQFHEQMPPTSANLNMYYPSYFMYQEHTEQHHPRQQLQYEGASRAATGLTENVSNDNLYFHGHELENHNPRLQTAQLQHQTTMQPSSLVEQLGRPPRSSLQGCSRQTEVSTAQPRISHSNGTFNSTDSRLRSPLNLNNQFALPHLSATPHSQSTSQYEHGQQLQGLVGETQNVQKSPSRECNRRSSNENHSSLNQTLNPISSRVAECTSTSRTPDIESNISRNVGNSYTTPNNTVVQSEPVITTVVVKTEVVPKQIESMECIVIDDNDDDISNHSDNQNLSSPTITSSLTTTQTQDNSLSNLSKVCICNEEAIFICVCKKALYCSIECQKKDWEKHSFACI